MLGLELTRHIPLLVYFSGFALVFLAIFYKTEVSFIFLSLLLPLSNLLIRMQSFPFGKDFVDMLLIAILIGWFIHNSTNKQQILERTPFNKIFIFSH